MSLPSLVILVILAVQLCGCATNQAAIDDMERRHALMLERGGGGSGGGGM
jgi:type IV pilus biogenesis protein CpaD/CtpE